MKNIRMLLVLLAIFAAFIIGTFFGKVKTREEKPGTKIVSEIWTCSMHPQIRQPKPGKCPICAMDLIPVSGGAGYDDKDARPLLKLSESAVKLAEIETAPAERKFVPIEIRMAGKAAYDESRMAYITARFPGRIDKLFVNYTGIAVKKGEHVAEIYSPDLLIAQQEVLQSLNLNKKAGADDIFAEKIVKSVKEKFRLWGFPDEQVDEIIRKGEVSDHLTITAPISGIVVEKNVVEGKYFEMGENLFAIADLSAVWINLDAYESDISWIKYGQSAQFSIESEPGKVFHGRVVFVQPVLNEMTRTVKVRLNADNPSGNLRPGMFVRAVLTAKFAKDGRIIEPSLAGKWISPMHPEIVKDTPGKCDVCGMELVTAESLGFADAGSANIEPPLVIPASAPLVTGKRAVVYVEKEKGSYEGREIVLGPRAGDYYVVESGLNEGELVVVKGNFKIDSSLQILAKPSMMAPKRSDEKTPPEKKVGDISNVPENFRKQLDMIYNSYFSVQEALAGDNYEKALENAKTLAEMSGHIDAGVLEKKDAGEWKKLEAEINASAGQMIKSENITDFRSAFANLSAAIDIMAEKFGGTMKIVKFHCPMAFDNKGADWLQKTDEIANPYFGTAMPKCGEKVREGRR
jgi:Cu(I)/Ag(I) efflux system membrane fusion protein